MTSPDGLPIVSVVTATLNRPKLLTRAIGTALRQSFSKIEVIVVVDGDDPESIEALRKIADTRLKYIVHPENRGAGLARDTGVSASRGIWIAFLDDDDEWLPDKLEKQVAACTDDSRTISTTLSHVVARFGTFIHRGDIYTGAEPVDEWLFGRRSWFGGGQLLQTSSLMVPRTLFNQLRFGRSRHEEWELVIRAVKQMGFRLVTVREPLVIYYAGGFYAWKSSLEWVESVRDLLSARAYSGFCLTVAPQGLRTGWLESADRNRAFVSFLRLALRHGRPTMRQLFAFAVLWLFPDHLRYKVRASLAGRRQAE